VFTAGFVCLPCLCLLYCCFCNYYLTRRKTIKRRIRFFFVFLVSSFRKIMLRVLCGCGCLLYFQSSLNKFKLDSSPRKMVDSGNAAGLGEVGAHRKGLGPRSCQTSFLGCTYTIRYEVISLPKKYILAHSSLCFSFSFWLLKVLVSVILRSFRIFETEKSGFVLSSQPSTITKTKIVYFLHGFPPLL
jgi:hypothetical protein